MLVPEIAYALLTDPKLGVGELVGQYQNQAQRYGGISSAQSMVSPGMAFLLNEFNLRGGSIRRPATTCWTSRLLVVASA